VAFGRPGLFLALGLLCAAAPQAKPPDAATYGDRILVQKDIAFGDKPHQKLDLYLPKGEGSFPLAVCWFGGGFTGGNKSGMARVGAFLASKGIAAAAPGYFLADPKGEPPGWPTNVRDAKAAVRFLRSKSGEYRFDATRIAALGHSSGAYLALMVGLTPHLRELDGEEPGSSAVVAVVDIAGVCDRRKSLGTGTLALLGKGFEEKDDLRALASPILYVGPKSPPIYILHGEQDKTVDVSSARQLDEALEKAGVLRKLHLLPSGGHDPITLEALESIAEWLKERLK
jgi:acetyl esterase/lipase